MNEGRPFWLATEGVSYPPLDSDASVEVAIIGAGICGIAAARWLVASGITSVAVLEGRQLCSGASGRNAGFVMAVAPENFPADDQLHSVEQARRIWQFTAQNQRLIEEAVEEFNLACDYRRLGSLALAADPQEWDWLVTSVQRAISMGESVELVQRDTLQNGWVRENYLGGAWFARNAEINPVLFVRGLARALAGKGVRVHELSPVDAVEPTGDGHVLHTRGHKLHAQYVIVASNAYTQELLPNLGCYIRATRGQVVATEPLSVPVAPCPVYANYGFQYWRQTPNGNLILGGWRDLAIEKEIGTREDLNPVIQGELEKTVFGLTSGAGGISFRWAGIMGFTPDKLPLVGPVPGRPHMAIAAGFSGHGLAMAFHASKQAVEVVLDELDKPMDLFDPSRFFATNELPGDRQHQ